MENNKKEENEDTIILKKYNCVRCNHEWIPRKASKPRVCPNCISAYWNIPRGALN